MKKKGENGVTLISLGITIVVLVILAGITIKAGSDSIKRANLEELKTNMLLIQAKSREYIEDASFKLGIKPEGRTYEAAKTYLSGENKGTNINNISDEGQKEAALNIGISETDIQNGKVYVVSTENIEKMGINDVKSDSDNGWYIIVYDLENMTAEIYHTLGFEGKYSLTELEKIEFK